MATIDMGKTDEEIYGVEHLGNIVEGNWKIFGEAFGDRDRTRVFFGEIAELRHNISHRRQRHMLRRVDLLRFASNAQHLLSALGSPASVKFEAVIATLEQGRSPWGNELGGTLPPATEIVPEFVGREAEMRALTAWLAAESARQIVIWGYGGSGKSALAYQFARDVREGAPPPLEGVLWVSAKAREYVEGETRDRHADFDSIASFAGALWSGLYGAEPSPEQTTREGILKELSDNPSLIVVDDLDSVLDVEDLAHFLLYELPGTKSRFVYTSRQRIPGLQTVEVKGFNESELESFVRSRARAYKTDAEQWVARISAIKSLTEGFPLFVDDLLRHALLSGLQEAIKDWSQRKGDAAREYALRRQLSSLGEAARRALIGVAVANRSVSSLELADISGFTDDDVQYAINDLLKWRLLTHSEQDASGRPTFSCNANTRRLAQKTYGRDPLFETFQSSFRALSGSPVPPGLRRAVGSMISNARLLILRGDIPAAEEAIRASMTGELEQNADLWGALGWVLSRYRDQEHVEQARFAFRHAHGLGSRKEDTYFHWVHVEIEGAERLVEKGDDSGALEQWRAAENVAEMGIERCGETPSLCQSAAYLRTREGKTLLHMNRFKAAHTCFGQGAEWARRALMAPNAVSRDVSQGVLYRTLVTALEGTDDMEATVGALLEWRSAVGSGDFDWLRERDRLERLPEFRGKLR